MTDQLTVTAGVRWTRDEKDWVFDFFPVFAPLPTENIVDDLAFDAWTPKLGIDYQVEPTGAIDSLLLYTSAARGFKSGGFNGINIFDTSVAQSNYGPEKNWTYEIGFKTEMFDNRFRLNANYFHNRIDDLTLNATVEVNDNLTFPVQNAGDATIQGVEVEASALLFEGFSAFAIATFLDGKFRNLNPTTAPATALASFGVVAQTPQTADYAVTLGFDYNYDFEIGGALAVLGLDYYHTDDYIIAATNDFRIDSYSRLNGYAALAFDERWEARLTVQNIEDDRSFITGSRGLGGFIAQPPRTYKFMLKYTM